MRYFLAAAAALCLASGASAAKDLTIQADPNSSSFEITQLRLVGAGMGGYFQEDMCNIGPCKIAPPVTYPVSIDITFTFAPISKVGWQTVESLSHYFPGTNSIVNFIRFHNGAFVAAYGFRDSDSDLGCYYSTMEEHYTKSRFTYDNSSCQTEPGDDSGGGIRHTTWRLGSITEIWINGRLAMIPEPATWAMLITGFGLVGATVRRRRALAA